MPSPKIGAKFIEPMESLAVGKSPEGSQWLWELKLDGYRAIGVKSGGRVRLYSRNSKPFDTKFACIVEALGELPDDTTVEGEIVALDDSGRPSFNLLQVHKRGLVLPCLGLWELPSLAFETEDPKQVRWTPKGPSECALRDLAWWLSLVVAKNEGDRSICAALTKTPGPLRACGIDQAVN